MFQETNTCEVIKIIDKRSSFKQSGHHILILYKKDIIINKSPLLHVHLVEWTSYPNPS